MKIKGIEKLASTKWLSLKQVTWLDKNNKEQKWDFVERIGDQQVVTVICKSRQTNKLLFIAQPRVPVNKIVIEFPAGLIDPGETIEQAALRELVEETGYDGEVIATGPFVSKSAGLTNEVTAFVECLVDEKAVGNTEMGETEDIQSFWLTPNQFKQMAATLNPDKTIIDALVWFYLSGYLTAKRKPKKRSKTIKK
ncbi:MAG: NUDIX domain-containing protein [Promethearchaeota archaeon]